MIVPLEIQLQGFVLAVLMGVFLGILYDAFRIFRVLWQSPVSQVFWCDLFYMALAALFTFLLAVGVSSGEVRYYIIAGEAFGFCVYFFTVGMISIRLARLVNRILQAVVFRPLKKIYKWLDAFLTDKCKAFAAFVKKRFRKPKKRLKPHKKIVYNGANHSGDKRRKKRRGAALK